MPTILPPVADLALPAPCVVMLVGVTGSGKTAAAEHLAAALSDAAVVGYARCHAELYDTPPTDGASPAAVALALDAVRARTNSGQGVVIDGTHLDAVQRGRVRAAAGALPIVALALTTPAALYRTPHPGLAHQADELARALRALPHEGYAAVHTISVR